MADPRVGAGVGPRPRADPAGRRGRGHHRLGVLVGIYWVWRLAGQGYLRRGIGTRPAGLGAERRLPGWRPGWRSATAQWLPGLIFLSQSQRATATYTFFTSGSLDDRLLTLAASPFALGTNQGWPAAYAGTYNFPEVTSYVGILALIAACTLFLKRWRTRPEARQWWIWYGILVIGVLSSLGGQTPFARLMYLIPGVRQRTPAQPEPAPGGRGPGRPVGLVGPPHPRPTGREPRGAVADASPARARWRAGQRAEIVVTTIPFAFTAARRRPPLARPARSSAACSTSSTPWAPRPRLRLAGLVTAGRGHRRRGHLDGAGRRALLGPTPPPPAGRWYWSSTWPCSTCSSSTRPSPRPRPRPAPPWPPQLAARTGDGRFIIYDPDRFETQELYALGQTDLNIYRQAAQRPGLHGPDRRRLLRRHRRPPPGDPRPDHPGRPGVGPPQRDHPARPARLLRDAATGLGDPNRSSGNPDRAGPGHPRLLPRRSEPAHVDRPRGSHLGDPAGPGPPTLVLRGPPHPRTVLDPRQQGGPPTCRWVWSPSRAPTAGFRPATPAWWARATTGPSMSTSSTPKGPAGSSCVPPAARWWWASPPR